MNLYEQIKAMNIDEMSVKLAAIYLAGCFLVLRKCEIPDDKIIDFGERNFITIIENHKKLLESEDELLQENEEQ